MKVKKEALGKVVVDSLEVANCWHANIFTLEVLDGLQRIGFLYSTIDRLEQGPNGSDSPGSSRVYPESTVGEYGIDPARPGVEQAQKIPF